MMMYNLTTMYSLYRKILQYAQVWLYGRLSRDEDKELNSMKNQMGILRDFAEQNECTIIDESFDDNVSGMHFSRFGIHEMFEAVELGLVSVILVKDISRLGRHLYETMQFIEVLREHKVRVISVSENIDTFNPADQMMLNFKFMMNNHYAIESSQKVSTTLNHKQKQGLVLTPPFGYYKDKNTNEVLVVEECAEIISLIYGQFLEGNGCKRIARYLSEHGYHTPSYYQWKLNRKRHYRNMDPDTGKDIWHEHTIKRILTNEAYIGVLVNHKTETNKNWRVQKSIPVEEQYRHENFLPAIVTKNEWEEVQEIFQQRKKSPTRVYDVPKNRYAGLLRCRDCGRIMTAKKRMGTRGELIVEYICTTYHRFGNKFCTSHRLLESELDKYVMKELNRVKKLALPNWDRISDKVDKY